jgi:hypothetical protein
VVEAVVILRRLHVRHALGLDAPGRRERFARVLLAATTVGCAVIVVTNFVAAPLLGHFSGQFEDFRGLLYGGSAANAGTDIYASFVPRAHDTLVAGLFFDYLPIVAFAARPLAALPHNIAVTLWLWVLLSCTIAGCIVIARATLPPHLPRTAIGFTVAVIFAPAIDNIWHGQLDAVVLFTFAMALRAWVRGDEVACGVWLGLGGVTKVGPAVLLILLLARRWWRGFAAGIGVVTAALLASGILVGFGSVVRWFTQVLPVLSRPDGWYLNEGWNAVVNRLAEHNISHVDTPNSAIQLAVFVLSALTLLGAAVCVRPGDTSHDRRALEFGVGITAFILAGTISWYHAYAALAIPLLAVAALAARRASNRTLAIAAAFAAGVAGVALPLFLATGAMRWVINSRGTLWAWPALQLDSIPAFSAALLLIALMRTLRRRRPHPLL